MIEHGFDEGVAKRVEVRLVDAKSCVRLGDACKDSRFL